MIRTLRGAWSRRGTLLPLLLLTAVVVAGAVTVISFAAAADTSASLAVPLLLLGAIAVPATGRELAAARRGEIALARLRGLQGAALTTLVTAEPLIVLLLGGVLGVGLGAVGGLLAAHAWTDGTATLGLTAVLAGLAVVVVGLVAVVAGMSAVLREPLHDQVSIASRPRSATTAALFGYALLVVAAVVAVYRSSQTSGDPDWVVLAGPALVGLVAGQVAVWLVRLAAAAAVGRSGGGLAGFLAVRRLARVADAATPVRILVAAAVVAAVAVTGSTQVDDWADETARLRAGAPLQVALDDDAVGALTLTRDLDPDGRWLMAAVLVPDEGSVVARRAFLDTARYDNVLGDFYDGTPAAAVAGRVDSLGGTDTTVATGDQVSATVQGVSRRRSGLMRPVVTVGYRTDTGEQLTAEVSLQIETDGAPVTSGAALSGCEGGCTVDSIVLARSAGGTTLPWVLTTLTFGGVDALARGWQAVAPDRFGRPGGPVEVDDGLLAPATRRPLEAEPAGPGPRLPILATDTATWSDGPPGIASPGGDDRAAQVVARLPGLPLVEADGLLADLPRAAAGAPPTVPAAEVMVLARADTPDDVLSALVDAAGHRPRTLAQAVRATSDETGAAQARVYTLMALFCLVVALLVLVTAVARQRGDWRRDLAALRVIGVATPALRTAGRLEVLLLTVATVAATVGGALVAVLLLLGNLSLVSVPVHAVPLRTALAAWPLVLAAGAVGVVVLLVLGRGRSVGSEASRPSILREEAVR